MPWLFSVGRFIGSTLLLAFTALLFGVALIPAWLLVSEVDARFGRPFAVGSVPFGFMAWGASYALLVVAIKWLTWSRFKPGTYAFFSPTVVRWAFIGYIAEMGHWVFLKYLIGTPYLNWWYRLLGARIGRRVTINTVIVGDWDMLDIGDDVFIGGRATIIGHVGEMGNIVLAPVRIGNRCTVGQESAVFPGTVMEDGAVLGANSLAPKHSLLPADQIWGGTPARFIKERKKKGAARVDAMDLAAREHKVDEAA